MSIAAEYAKKWDAPAVLDNGGAVFNVKHRRWGAVGDGVTDDTAALAAVQAAVAALGRPARIVFPAGTYLYSVSPNWAMQDVEIVAVGHVRLRYTGTGNAVILDAGAASGNIYNCDFGGGGRFIIEAPNTAQNAIFVRSLHASRVRAKVLGAGTTFAGLRVDFAVCTVFDVIVSVNHEGWYSAVKPENGYYLTSRNAGETVSYCTFPNPIVEGPDVGIYLHNTLGNVFLGGTSEGCATYGVFVEDGAEQDRFYGTDFEANGQDVQCNGDGTVFDQCDSIDLIQFGATAHLCEVVGGLHESITMAAGSRGCTVRDLSYNRSGAGGEVTNSGHNNRVRNIIDGANEYPISDGERYVTLEDDFLGDILAAHWNGAVGGNANVVAPATGGSVAGGYVRLVAGDSASADMPTNGVQMNQGATQWRSAFGDLEMEFRVKLDAITNVAWFVGLTDQVAALEMPCTLGAANALTSNASDAVGVLFDTAADTDQWALVGVAADVDAAVQFSGAAPVANTYERWRIHVTGAGVARFWRNGMLVGSAMTGALTPATLLTPVIAGFSRGAAVRRIDCDRIKVRMERE